ncbi:hypothetical protein K2X40_01350 [Candidatus Babeliales bacterium]|nr:hypothetical protein [Candidatus Babeliales bacterium]
MLKKFFIANLAMASTLFAAQGPGFGGGQTLVTFYNASPYNMTCLLDSNSNQVVEIFSGQQLDVSWHEVAMQDPESLWYVFAEEDMYCCDVLRSVLQHENMHVLEFSLEASSFGIRVDGVLVFGSIADKMADDVDVENSEGTDSNEDLWENGVVVEEE